MGLRRQFALRSAAFVAGLVPLALRGLIEGGWCRLRGGRPDDEALRRAALRALRNAERAFPGILTSVPFGERCYLLQALRHARRVAAGSEFAVEVVLLNNSETPWAGRAGEHPVRLGTWDPMDGASPFFLEGGWPRPDRAGELEQDVPSGQMATFRLRLRAPDAPGRYRQALAPVADGLRWFPGAPIVVEVEVHAGGG